MRVDNVVIIVIKSKFGMGREDNFGWILGRREIKFVIVFCYCFIELFISRYRRKERDKKIKEKSLEEYIFFYLL